jgi:hypothetical protein
MKTYVAVLLVGCAALCQAAAGQELRWKLQKGEKFQLQMKQETKSTVSLTSRKIPSSVEMQVNVSWDVQSAEDDLSVIEQTIDSIRIDMKGPEQQTVHYDSAEKKAAVGAAKDLQAAVAPLLGMKFTLTMDSLGAIKSATRISPPAGATAPAEAAKVAGLKAESIEKLLLRPLLPLPKGSVGAEASWTDEEKFDAALGEATLKKTFSLAGSEERAGKPAAKIKILGELTLIPPAAAPKGAPKLKEQSFSGSAWFSKEAGRVVEVERTLRLVTESMYRDSAITADLTTTINTTLMPRE